MCAQVMPVPNPVGTVSKVTSRFCCHELYLHSLNNCGLFNDLTIVSLYPTPTQAQNLSMLQPLIHIGFWRGRVEF